MNNEQITINKNFKAFPCKGSTRVKRGGGILKMKKLIIIPLMLLMCGIVSAQNNSRMAAVETAPGKANTSKAQADVLYGKTQDGQDKGLIFRQSVLDETNNGNAAENSEAMPPEEKLKLIDNKKATTKTTNKPN